MLVDGESSCSAAFLPIDFVPDSAVEQLDHPWSGPSTPDGPTTGSLPGWLTYNLLMQSLQPTLVLLYINSCHLLFGIQQFYYFRRLNTTFETTNWVLPLDPFTFEQINSFPNLFLLCFWHIWGILCPAHFIRKSIRFYRQYSVFVSEMSHRLNQIIVTKRWQLY